MASGGTYSGDKLTLKANLSNKAASEKKKYFRIELWQMIYNPSSYTATSKLRLKGSPVGFGLGLLRNKEGFIREEQTGKEQGHRLAVNKLV